MDRITRRQALTGLSVATGLGLAGCAETGLAKTETQSVSFDHGVASGDPRADAIIIWTRATVADPVSVPLRWQLAEDAAFSKIVAEGTAEATPARDHTAKVDVTGLAPGRSYFYRFAAGKVTSPIGRTRTLPTKGIDKARFAVVSCSHYAFGYYHVYREIAATDGIDAVVHLGDYIYEYGREGYGGEVGKALGREHLPPHEIVTLADYRARFAQYRTDPDLQAAHASAPFITVWDDHETANDSWVGGAENHDPRTEGKWETRRDAAIRAYFEWMPMRDPAPGEAFYTLNRSYDYGDIASLHVVETRLTGRMHQLKYARDMLYVETAFDVSNPARPVAVTDKARLAALSQEAVIRLKTPFDVHGRPIRDYAKVKAWNEAGLPTGYTWKPDTKRFRAEILNDERRTLMGTKQEAWLAGELKASTADGIKWQVLANQIVMAKMDAPDFSKAFPADIVAAASAKNPQAKRWIEQTKLGLPLNTDAWDGYPAARERLYGSARDAEANLLVLAGDSHILWANELHDDGGALRGVEFATSGVTSPSPYGYFGDDARVPVAARTALTTHCPEVKYVDVVHNGFILLTLTRDKAEADYIGVSTVRAKDYAVLPLARFEVTAEKPGKLSGLVKV